MMLLSGISSVALCDVSFQSRTVIPFIGCVAELYTAGCEVALNEGETKTLK